MKHGMPKRETLGKQSTFLKSLKTRKNKGQSENRELYRENKIVPNSSKGKGGLRHGINVIRSRKQLRRAS